jgi:hypothetical protein
MTRTPPVVFAPEPRTIERSAMTAFRRFSERETGRQLPDDAD